MKSWDFTISGYTTTYNCLSARYPLDLSINSLLGFCDEVIIVDSGSTDGTWEHIQNLSRNEMRIRIFQEPVDFSHPRWAVHNDGYLKAKARDKCRGDYCWQMDVDEIVLANDYPKISFLPEVMGPREVIMLPMAEFWGSLDVIRADFLSYKLRFSKNDPRITHGIPKSLRLYDQSGHEYPRPFDSDCCNYIYRDTLEDVPYAFCGPAGFANLSGPADPNFKEFLTKSFDCLPSVLHTSWLDLPRKIRHHKAYWSRYQYSMYNLVVADTSETNVMFDKPWAQVTDEEIEAKAKQLKEIGPRSFHSKIDPSFIGPTVPFDREVPVALREWFEAGQQKAHLPERSHPNTDAISLLL